MWARRKENPQATSEVLPFADEKTLVAHELHSYIYFLHNLERNAFEDSEISLLDLKLFFFRTLLDWMLVLRNHSICLVSDLIHLCNLSDWLYGPQLYAPPILGWLYSLTLIKLHYLSNKEKACYICKCINLPSVFTLHNHSTKSCDMAPLHHTWKSSNTQFFNQLGV